MVQVSDALDLDPRALPNSWRYLSKKNFNEQDAQIDLLFICEDAITLSEIKYTQEPFVIDKIYARQLQQKIAIFNKVTKNKKQIFLKMISANGLKKILYSAEVIDGLATIDDLFKKK